MKADKIESHEVVIGKKPPRNKITLLERSNSTLQRQAFFVDQNTDLSFILTNLSMSREYPVVTHII